MHNQNNQSRHADTDPAIIDRQAMKRDYEQGYEKKESHISGKQLVSQQEFQEMLDKDYMGKSSNWLTRGLSLHLFKVLPSFFTHLSNHQFISYRPEYEPMISTKYLWHRFRNCDQKFSLLKELFFAERCPIIVMIIISAIIGVLALAGAYFQRYLFIQLIEPSFPTSGWVYFGLISGSAILRFFLFNWVQNMANQIAINMRCYLENALVKIIFYVPEHMSQGLLLNNLFLSPDIFRNSVKLIPYFIMSLVIVFGIVGFIIGIVGHIGWIVLGLTILVLIIEFCMLKKMYHWHHEYVHAADKRTSLLLTCNENLLKLAKSGQSKTYSMMMDESRKKQTQIDMKYNTFDGRLIQVLIESVSFISVFVFYVVSEATLVDSGDSYPNYKQIFQAVILFSVFKTPIKMVAYGLAIGLDGWAAITRVQNLFDKCSFIPPIRDDQSFRRIYANPSVFSSTLEVKGKSNPNVSVSEQKNELNPFQNQNYRGKMVMVLGKLQANPNCDDFIKTIKQNIPISSKYYKIDDDAFIEDKSIRDNILFGQPYDQKRYSQILDLLYLKEIINQFQLGDQTKMHENYFKTIYEGLELRIQLARALYCNADMLIINRLVFKQYQTILENVKKYRNQMNQITIIVNLSGSYYHIADWLVVLGKDGHRQEGTYKQLTTIKKSKILEEFQTQYHLHQKLIQKDFKSHNKDSGKLINKLEEEPVDAIQFKFSHIFSFYNLSHYGAPIILFILIVLPPLLDLYTEVIVAQSAKIWQKNNEPPIGQSLTQQQNTKNFDHIITLRYGITILGIFVINILKIIMFSVYLRFSAYKIVRKMANTLFASKIQQILTSSTRRNALNLQVNIENIDTRVTADLDVGMTIIFQQLTALVFGAVSSLLFLAIGKPFLIVTFCIIFAMINFNRKILLIRRQALSKFNSFIKKLILHRESYVNMNKKQYVSNQFIKNNKIDIIADLNQQWMMQSLGIVLEIVFILVLIITMVVSLLKFQDIQSTNPAFIQLAISFLIGMTNGGRINLKIFQSMDEQLVGITSMFKLIDRNQNKRKFEKSSQQKDQKSRSKNYIESAPPTYPQSIKIQTLEFKNFSLKFHDDILKAINLRIRSNDRMVITGSRRGGKTVAIYSILGIFQNKHTEGDIQINDNLQIYRDHVPRQLISVMMHVLDGSNYSYLENKTIQDGIRMSIPSVTAEEIGNLVAKIWTTLEIQPLFSLQTVIHELSTPQKELVSLIRAILLKPQILVIEGGFNHLAGTNRRKITQWLIQNKDIPILIDLTNRIQVIQLYKRHLHFEDGKLAKDQTIP